MTEQPPTTEQAFRDAIAANAGGMARLRPSRRADAAEDLHAAIVKAHREVLGTRLMEVAKADDAVLVMVRDLHRGEQATLQAHVAELAGRLDEISDERTGLLNELAQIRDDRVAARAVMESTASQRDRARAERDEAAAEVGRLSPQLSEALRRAASAETDLAEARGQNEELRTELDNERETLEAAEVTIRALTAENARLREQMAAFLAERKARRDEFVSAITDIANSEQRFYGKLEPATGSPPARKPPMTALPPTAAESAAIAEAAQTPAATPAPGGET